MAGFNPFKAVKNIFAAAASGGPVWRGDCDDFVLSLYDDGVIIGASTSAAGVLGVTGKLVGRSIFDFIDRSDHRIVRASLERAAGNDRYMSAAQRKANFRLMRVRRAPSDADISFKANGSGRLTALVRLQEIPAHGAPLGVMASGRDRNVSPVKEQSVEANENASIAITPDLAHEMKTPLNAILGFADTMRSESYGAIGHEKYLEYAGDIHAAGGHLLDVVNAALDSARLEKGVLDVDRQTMDPGQLALECARVVEPSADGTGIAFRVEIDDALPEASLDPRVVKQILINLLTNAVKFTKAGEIALSVSERNGEIVYGVSDTGIGMNQIVLAKLGGRWSDTHMQGVRGAGGAGLGLSLAFGLARAHGGVLELTSAPGVGTKAKLRLPIDGEARIAGAGDTTDIQSQLDRVAAYRRERETAAA